MLATLFRKPSRSQSPPASSQLNITPERMASSNLAPRISVHCGIPSTASILAFDPIQSILAVGTLDGRIKVIGGENIEGLLISPKALPFKNLEFLQNQGFLVSVSNGNEIEVWNLEKRCISSNIQWESNITAFSVISDANYMYIGDEYGFLSVLKYDSEEENILQLPYHVPPNLISEGVGITFPNQQSIVGVLSQPCSSGNRVLIAYDNGLIVLWDIIEDKVAHVRGHKDLQLKEEAVFDFSNNENTIYPNDTTDDEEMVKEISCLCWVSPDGSVLAVGYVDGDILLWDLSLSENVKGQKTKKPSNDVAKIQLSSGDRRLPVIVLHWSSNKSENCCGGQLFAYGGEDIGSEEVLTILELDWSSGLTKLKCIERVDLTLHGSFADISILPNAYKSDDRNTTSLFVLTNPGQLHYYEYASLSIFKSRREKNHYVHEFQYHSVIPTGEAYMSVGKLYSVSLDRNFLGALSEGGSTKWPLTGGVPSRISTTESRMIERIYIGGYRDGSVRIWDATFPVLSLVSVLGFEMKGTQIAGASESISALDFSSASTTLSVGNECGLIFLYRLQEISNETTVTVATESGFETNTFPSEERDQCFAIYSVLKSPVCALQFAMSGVRLVAGFEGGQVAVLDTSSGSVLFVTNSISSVSSPVISLALRNYPDTHESCVKNSGNEAGGESLTEIAFVLTKDAHMVLIDGTTGNVISSPIMHTKENSKAIGMYLLEFEHSLIEGSGNDLMMSSQHIEAQSQPLQESNQNQSGSSRAEDAMQPTHIEHRKLASHILLCCEKSIYLYSLKSVNQGDNHLVHEVSLEKPCSWTTIFRRGATEYGFIIVYQTGEIEIRSMPDLKLLGSTSMMSTLRWNFKNNMAKTMSASDNGQITLVNGCEFAIVSLLASENEFRLPESQPCLYDKVLAAAAYADKFSKNQKRTQTSLPGFVGSVLKGLKGVEREQDMTYTEAREIFVSHLERIFSRFPFSDSYNEYDLEDLELHIDDIEIEEHNPLASSSQEPIDRITETRTEKERLFEGGSSDSQPKVRTREEIIAKYRGTDAASQARDKLVERQEKLEKLSRRTEELQTGAENFASMANELAKAMEKRKWWNI